MREQPHQKKIWLERNMVDSKAFLALSGKAVKVLIYFLRRRRMVPISKRENRRKTKEWIVENNGQIQFTYKEAKEWYGIGFQTFSRVLDELVEHGFLDITVPGVGFDKSPTLYALSDRWEHWGTDRFNQKQRNKRMGHVFAKGKRHWKHLSN